MSEVFEPFERNFLFFFQRKQKAKQLERVLIGCVQYNYVVRVEVTVFYDNSSDFTLFRYRLLNQF